MTRPRLASAALPLAILIGAALGVALVLLVGWQGQLRYAGIPVLEGSLPQPAGTPSPTPPAPDMHAAAPLAVAPPVEPDPALLEASPDGALPVIAADGRPPLRAYARPSSVPAGPYLAILVTGLGLAAGLSEAGIGLPPEITLAFSPYANDPAAWMRQARQAGHEVMLQATLAAEAAARVDAGPLGLEPRQAEAVRSGLLQRLLGRSTGYIGLAGEAGAFDAKAFTPLARELGERGLGFVELGGGGLADAEDGLGYVSSGSALDETPALAGLDQALGALEAEALTRGHALGWTRSHPALLERLGRWAASLPGKGIALVPVSLLLTPPAAGAGHTTPEVTP